MKRTHTDLSPTLTLTDCHERGEKGFWLYDKTRGMNLAMRAIDEREALVNALMYYQKRLLEVEKCYASLEARVNDFVSGFTEEENE